MSYEKKMWAVLSVMVVLSMLLAACATPTAEVIEKVVTQVIKETVKETVIVEGTPQVVEKVVTKEVVVKETVVVEKEVEAAPETKEFVVGVSFDQATLDPGRGFEITGGMVHKATYNTLVTWADDNVSEIVPSLAESWEVSEGGKVFTFKLRQGVKFHSGNEMTAADVEWSWERAMGLKGNPSFLFDGVVSIEAPDAYTVVVTKEKPDPAFLAKSTFGVFSVLDSQVVIEHGGTSGPDADQSDQAEEWLNQNSAGTGPFILKSWVPETEVVVEKFADYWRGPAFFDRVIYRNIPDTATQKLTLEAGGIDLAVEVSSDQVAALELNPEIKVVKGQGTDMFFLLCNANPELTAGVMSDDRVRMAIRYAIDYDGILALVGGSAITPATIVPYGFMGAWGPDRAFKRDLGKAQELLAEAGYPNGFDIEMEYPTKFARSGVDFDIIAEKVQADLAEAGINVTLKPGELMTVLARYRAGEEGFSFWMWGADYYDVSDYLEFLPEGIVGLRAQWTDERADQEIRDLRDAAAVEMDNTKRAEIWADIQAYLQLKSPFVPLVQPGAVVAHRQWLKGYVFNEAWKVDPFLCAK
ncbi:MAG: ABC transporter substrate-binding protein [Chloroflexota bacterium]